MVNADVTVFLPCRAGSERVKAKNTRPFAGVNGGLLAVKMAQLQRCEQIASIVVSTDDPIVKAVIADCAKNAIKPVLLDDRPAELCRSETTTDTLIEYVANLIPEGTILWTHVTAPFADEATYARAIALFRAQTAQGLCDSLMTVNLVQTFLWSDTEPINYDRSIEKWPRTQTLPRWYEVNSALFIASAEVYRSRHDRIGESPYMLELGFPEFVDIDTEDNFKMAESIYLALQ